MKTALPVFVALALLGCSDQGRPTAPDPPATTASPPTPPGALTSLFGFVVESSGLCIRDAVVEVVRGQAQGQRIVQETPCDAWSYGAGFIFTGLSPGVEMTVRASAPGWSTEEKTFVPHLGVQTTVQISLKKL
jgi:hypothetical protein